MNRTRLVVIVLAALVVTACDVAGTEEVQQWMAQVRQSVKPTVQPVPEAKRFMPQAYEERAAIDPFDPQKVVVALARQQRARVAASTIRPDLDRRKEVLEEIPLDQLRMVGVLEQQGNRVALISGGGATHMVRPGNYMGQNFGLVTQISETEVQLKEIVQDAAGEWVERMAKLELQDAGSPTQGRRQ